LMTTGRCLLLLYFATILTVSDEKPTRRMGEGEINKDYVDFPSDDNSNSSKGPPRSDTVTPTRLLVTEDEMAKNIVYDEEDFDKRIFDRPNPRPIPFPRDGRTYACHELLPSEIPIEYACDLRYTIRAYSEVDQFLEDYRSWAPSVTHSDIRRVAKTSNIYPCVALMRSEVGHLTISCGCDHVEVNCADLPLKASKIVEFIQMGTERAKPVEKTPSEKGKIFFDRYKWHIMSGIILLLSALILLVISIVEWKGMKNNEQKRSQRIQSLSDR
ncbi:hypothetical protein PFISCL1PPCAC_1440, partial [Pristionchus fissidentatus]